MYQNKNSVFNNTKQNLLTYMTDTNIKKQVIYSTKEIKKQNCMIHMHAYKIKIINLRTKGFQSEEKTSP